MTKKDVEELCVQYRITRHAADKLIDHAYTTGVITDDSTEMEQLRHYTHAIILLRDIIHEQKHDVKQYRMWLSGKDRSIGSD